MSLTEVIASIWTDLSWKFSVLISRLTDFFQPVLDVLGFFWGVIKWIWYWLWSLLWSLFDLIAYVFDSSVFVNVNSAFINISNFIWWPATIFLVSVMLLWILRMFIWFVFSILKWNIQYSTLSRQTWRENAYQRQSDWRKRTIASKWF